MHVGRQYSVREVLTWTRTAIVFFTLLSGLPTIAWVVYGQRWMALPWQPKDDDTTTNTIFGTAVAFVTGFQNNAAYGRLWEARQIWGSIINLSRTWAVQVLDLPTSAAEVKKRLVDRHLGWLTALRYQLREKRAWETVDRHDNKAYQHFYDVPEWKTELAVELELDPLCAIDCFGVRVPEARDLGRGRIAKRATVLALVLFRLYYANYTFWWITPPMLDFTGGPPNYDGSHT